MARSPLGAEHVASLDSDLIRTLEERWPGLHDEVREHGLEVGDLVWGRLLFPVDKAERELGYRPRYDFDAFLEAWRRSDRSYYPYADEPRWGVQGPSEAPDPEHQP